MGKSLNTTRTRPVIQSPSRISSHALIYRTSPESNPMFIIDDVAHSVFELGVLSIEACCNKIKMHEQNASRETPQFTLVHESILNSVMGGEAEGGQRQG